MDWHPYDTIHHDTTRHNSRHAYIFLFFVMIYIHLKGYTPSDVHLIMCALFEKKWLKKLMHQKKNKILFPSMFFPYFFNFE
jgi:hypothetical protein